MCVFYEEMMYHLVCKMMRMNYDDVDDDDDNDDDDDDYNECVSTMRR